jgi:hypothetical protein
VQRYTFFITSLKKLVKQAFFGADVVTERSQNAGDAPGLSNCAKKGGRLVAELPYGAL